MKNKLLFSYLFLCFWPLNIYASIDFISKKITLNDGLCNNNVKHIYQDTKGFIWISTLNGLSRYDGTSFITLKPDENDLHSIKDHRIDHIIEDNNGLIWIYSPSENFCCYNLRKEKYMNFYGNEDLNQKYSKIYIASNGEIWLWHNRNGCRKIIYNGTDLSSTAYKKEFNTLSSNNVLTVKEGLQGNIWIGTTAGLNLMNNDDSNIFMKEKSFENIVVYNNKEYFISKDNLIYSYSSESESLVLITKIPFGNLSITSSFNNNELWYIFSNIGMITYNIENDTFDANINYELKNGTYKTDNKNNHWIYNHSGNIWNIDSDNKILKLNLIPSNKLGFIDFERYNIYEDSRGLIWFSTYGNGAFIYDRNNNSVQHIKSNIDGTGLIDSDYLLCLFEDRQGGIWISSEYVGLSRLTVINEGTERILPNLKHLTDRSNTIRMVKQTGENEIWVATRNGELYCYDKDLNQKYSKQVFDYNIYSISIDPDGNKWIGSRGNGVLINNQWYKHDNKDTTSISENNIFSIYHDKKNRTWLGLFGGGLSLAYKENNRYKFRSFLNNNYNQKQLRVIEEDGNNNMWIGTNDGLFIINPDSIIENPENYQVLCVENHKLKSNEIKSLYYDKKGHMYISTSGEGFAICNINNSEIKYFNSKNGLLNDIILSINEDNNGNIWLATEYGISKFKPGSESFENFIFSSNSLANVYTENSSCRLKDGRILFGTNNGLMILHPEKLNYNSSSSKAAFTNLKVNGIDMKTSDLYFPIKESITYTDEIKLKYFQNSFTLDFSTFDFENNDLIRYKYILENYDSDWSIPSSTNFATYKNLDPGNYKFRLQSSNNSGKWSEEEISLDIIIASPFWMTRWAYLVYMILSCIVIFIIIRLIHNFSELKHKIELEKQLTEFKLVFFTNITHEFRTPLTLITGTIENILQIKDLPDYLNQQVRVLYKSSNKMLRLINQILEFRKLQNNKLTLSLEEDDIIDFSFDIFNDFKESASSKNISYKFNTVIAHINIYFDKQHIDKIINNLISNALKFTSDNGQIELDISYYNDKTLLFTIIDNGIGIPKKKQEELFKRFMHTNFSYDSMGIGLNLTSELVKIHKGEIWFEENPIGGAIFKFTIPLNPEIYNENDFIISTQKYVKKIVPETIVESEPTILNENSNNKKKILLIEDDSDVRNFISNELSLIFNIETAVNGSDGINKSKDYEPDLIISDVMMPVMDGFEVTKILKSDLNTSHIPIILLTALDMDDKMIEGTLLGADSYITKPFSPKFLIIKINQLLEQREQLIKKYTTDPYFNKISTFSDRDKDFMEQMHQILEQHIEDPDFNVDNFAFHMKMGRTVFYKKIKGLINYSPNEYIRIVRMKKAAELLRTTDLNVGEVACKVGINDQFYFSKCFKTQFGVSPSSFQKSEVT